MHINKRIAIRVTSEIDKKMDEIIQYLPEIYPNKSQLIRVSVMRLYKEELEKHGFKKKNKDRRYTD